MLNVRANLKGLEVGLSFTTQGNFYPALSKWGEALLTFSLQSCASKNLFSFLISLHVIGYCLHSEISPHSLGYRDMSLQNATHPKRWTFFACRESAPWCKAYIPKNDPLTVTLWMVVPVWNRWSFLACLLWTGVFSLCKLCTHFPWKRASTSNWNNRPWARFGVFDTICLTHVILFYHLCHGDWTKMYTFISVNWRIKTYVNFLTPRMVLCI